MKNEYFTNERMNGLIIGIMCFELLGQVTDIYALRLLKTIPIILMIVHLSLKNPTCDPLLLIMIKYGFVFSLVGDTLLMFSSLLLFMVGTSFFLIAHILYCVAETIGNKSTRTITSENRKKQIGGCIFLFLMFIGNVNTLWNVMPNQFLFTLYGGILCLMNILSLLRYQKTTADSFLQMALGAFLFGISDNLLALLKFNGISTNVGRMMIMLTYYMGQYFIMHGCISHVMKKNELRQFRRWILRKDKNE